ncbi:MAG: hypothetical protein AAFN93_20415 [Bacteroidota bacterium]
MTFSILLISVGLVSLYINWNDGKDRKEILSKGQEFDGLVKLRFWKGAQNMRNHNHYRLNAPVENMPDGESVIEKELTLDRRLYISPSTGSHIKLVSYGGDLYDKSMLNRKLEIYLSLAVSLIGAVNLLMTIGILLIAK